MAIPKINVPNTIPTRGIEQLLALKPTLEQLVDFGRGKEFDYERLKLYLDNVLQDGFEPYLPESMGITDEELELMIHQAGWTFQKDKFGTPEEWQMWTNRFRRFAAIVRSIKP